MHRKQKIINIFLLRILGVSEHQAKAESGLLVNILSDETISNLEANIKESDSVRCQGCVTCSKCSFRDCMTDARYGINMDSSAGCEFIHSACSAWQ